MKKSKGAEKNEQQLIDKARAGNRRAFGHLVKMHQDYILYLAYDFVGNYADAKDIAQESFMAAFEKLHQFEGTGAFRAWLGRITINTCKAHYRKKKRHETVSIDKESWTLDIQDTENSGNTLKTLEEKELHKQIHGYIHYLSSNQQTAIVLKYFQNKTSKEIAEIMECAESTVRIHLSRGIQKLRRYTLQLKHM